ncbi:MAG: DsbA family oxidoreductase [Ginsengibacter sp.]
MDVKIWSDVRCPFCYIGKKKFEMALENFPQKNKINIIWKSFQLDSSLKTNPDITAKEHFAEIKGISPDQVEGMYQHVENAAAEVKLKFNLEASVVANSFNAHRLIQFAKTKDLGNEIEEELFKAQFIDCKNIDDLDRLAEIGISIGLEEKEVREILASDAFTKEVQTDEEEARSIGVSGVPFFVFDNKYAVSGAQSPETFLQTLNQVWQEAEKEKPVILSNGSTCTTAGTCD